MNRVGTLPVGPTGKSSSCMSIASFLIGLACASARILRAAWGGRVYKGGLFSAMMASTNAFVACVRCGEREDAAGIRNSLQGMMKKALSNPPLKNKRHAIRMVTHRVVPGGIDGNEKRAVKRIKASFSRTIGYFRRYG